MNEEKLLQQIKMLKRSNSNYKSNFVKRSNKKFKHLEQQLQAYKDKEDKLREYLKSYYFEDNFVSIGVMKYCRNQIEEILNEGDK